MKRKLLLGMVFLSLIIAIFSVYVFFMMDETPAQEVDEARISLNNASKEKKLPVAEEIFNEAKSLYDSAMIAWQEENEKLFFMRDFSRVRMFAAQSGRMSLLSVETAKTEVSNIKETVYSKKDKLLKQVSQYNKVFNKVPLNKAQRDQWSKGNMLLQEGVQAYGNGNYPLAEQKFNSSESYILPVLEYVNKVVKDYFESYSDWKKWAAQAVDRSRKEKKYALVVDKFARNAMLYFKGNLHSEYEVELGPKWIGDKNFQGDKSTPEGIYKVTRKKANGETKYYKALLLNYPNDDDKKRFQSAKKNGLIDKNATIGNLIEVHGHGGKGIDWTDGCVALNDTDMDKLYPLCKVGTEVVIVGSLSSFEDLVK